MIDLDPRMERLAELLAGVAARELMDPDTVSGGAEARNAAKEEEQHDGHSTPKIRPTAP